MSVVFWPLVSGLPQDSRPDCRDPTNTLGAPFGLSIQLRTKDDSLSPMCLPGGGQATGRGQPLGTGATVQMEQAQGPIGPQGPHCSASPASALGVILYPARTGVTATGMLRAEHTGMVTCSWLGGEEHPCPPQLPQPTTGPLSAQDQGPSNPRLQGVKPRTRGVPVVPEQGPGKLPFGLWTREGDPPCRGSL